MRKHRTALIAALALSASGVVPAVLATSSAQAAAASTEIDMCNVGVKMSDGAVMRANVARPGPGKHPTVMVVDGYNKDLGDPEGQCSSFDEALTKAGFNVVVFDDRGTGSSDGTWRIWDHRTQRDYREELHWLEAQPWQNGKIGTTGTSYLAITSLLVAETGDRHVKAVFANYPMADAYRDVTYFGGELDSNFMPFWFGFTQATNANVPTQLAQGELGTAPASTELDHLTGGPAAVGGTATADAALDLKQGGVDEPYDDAEYKYMSPATRAGKIHAAVFWVGGWYDIFQRGEPYLWRALNHTPKGGKVWVQGPTYHAATINQWSSLGYGATEEDTEVAWFQHYLDGARNQFGPESAQHGVSPINLWEIGANHWGRYDSWPLPGTHWTPEYLSAKTSGTSTNSLNDGSLVDTADQATGSATMPFESVGGLCNRSLTQWSAGTAGAGSPCETNETAAETGTLTYTTAPAKQPMHLAGPITLRLWATLSKPDASLYATLTDVSSSGSTQMTSGGLDAEFRALDQQRTWRNEAGQIVLPYHPFTAGSLKPAPTGKPQLYQIEIYPTDWTIEPGHSLRLVLGTANTPDFTPPADRLAQMQGGTVQVLSSGAHRSSLLLPLR